MTRFVAITVSAIVTAASSGTVAAVGLASYPHIDIGAKSIVDAVINVVVWAFSCISSNGSG